LFGLIIVRRVVICGDVVGCIIVIGICGGIVGTIII